MARSVSQYFRSPKCLLAEVAVRTIETSRACSARLCEWRISSRISSAEETARITSHSTERKISRARIDTCDIERVPSLYVPLRLRDQAARMPRRKRGARQRADFTRATLPLHGTAYPEFKPYAMPFSNQQR